MRRVLTIRVPIDGDPRAFEAVEERLRGSRFAGMIEDLVAAVFAEAGFEKIEPADARIGPPKVHLLYSRAIREDET